MSVSGVVTHGNAATGRVAHAPSGQEVLVAVTGSGAELTAVEGVHVQVTAAGMAARYGCLRV